MLRVLALHDVRWLRMFPQPCGALLSLAALLCSVCACTDPIDQTHACINDSHVEATETSHGPRSSRVIFHRLACQCKPSC